MPYNGFENFDVQMALCDSWYSVTELVEMLTALRRGNFTTQQGRDQSLVRVNNMRTTAPFSENVRFPENRFFVRETDADWGLKFTQLRSALQYRDRREEKTGHEGSSATERFSSGQDAVRSAFAVIDRMLTEIRNREGVTDRAGFEAHYNVNWV